MAMLTAQLWCLCMLMHALVWVCVCVQTLYPDVFSTVRLLEHTNNMLALFASSVKKQKTKHLLAGSFVNS